jgi:zinc protease
MPSSRLKNLGLACTALALGVAVQTAARGQSSTEGAPKPATPAAAGAAVAPTADQILDRYVKAVGGREAWQKFTSRITTGTIEVPSMNLAGIVIIHEKAPDRLLASVVINGAAFRQGFDGTAGWTDDPQDGLRDQSGAELAEARRDADFYHPLDLRKLYTKLTVTGTEKIGDRNTYVVEAAVPEGSEPTKMYFDVESGLLLRVISQHHGSDGVTQFREDFDDYRDVDGIKVPFTSRQTNGDTTYTMTINEVHHNVDLDDSEFVKPAAQ